MNEEKNRQIYEKYLEATHRLGRLSCAVTLLLLLGAPFVMGAYLGAMPDLGAFGKGFASIGLVYFVSCVAEYLIYVPMLGAGGSYLAFITGNLIGAGPGGAAAHSAAAGAPVPGPAARF